MSETLWKHDREQLPSVKQLLGEPKCNGHYNHMPDLGSL